MIRRKVKLDPAKQARVVAEARRMQSERQGTYREQALNLFPHVCGRCGREYEGKNLRELTVHHKDSNHMNNPPNGSNWELLCIYCHDAEHEAYERTGGHRVNTVYQDADDSGGFNPFAALGGLLKIPEKNVNDEE